MRSYHEGNSFVDSISGRLDAGLEPAAIDELLDPTRYLGIATADVDAVLAAYAEKR
jgi:hypothetical protein